jgi:hypothetical protein
MKAKILLIAATTMALAPTLALAQKAPTTAPKASGSLNGPATTGQPSQDCEDLIATGAGSDPGKSADNGHSAFGGSAGDVYAGSQPQNSRNTASVSQYDVACANQPQ